MSSFCHPCLPCLFGRVLVILVFLVFLAMSLSSLSFWPCPCLPCPFGHVLVFLVFLVLLVMSLSSLSVLVILVFSEGKTEDTIFWGKTRWFLREKQGDTRETRFLREKGALSEGKPAHTRRSAAKVRGSPLYFPLTSVGARVPYS